MKRQFYNLLSLVLLGCTKEEVKINYNCEKEIISRFTGNDLEPYIYYENIQFQGTENQMKNFEEKFSFKKTTLISNDTLIEIYKTKCIKVI